MSIRLPTSQTLYQQDFYLYLTEVFEETYQDARDIVIVKTELPSDVFPIQSTFSLEQVLDESWLPDLD